MSLALKVLSEIPPGLLDCRADELHDLLDGPALIHVRGDVEPPLFVSVLLHGNETSGWDGLRRCLQNATLLPRSLFVFIGNVEAAAAELRVLPGQQDFNRIWRDAAGPGGVLAGELDAALRGIELFAAVDLHNNTGHNPFYSVLTEVDDRNLGLAYLFSDKAVYIQEPDSTLTQRFTGRCPAVTLEVGPVGDPRCDERVVDYLERCLALEEVPVASFFELQLFEALARVHVRGGVDFSFAGEHTFVSGEGDTPLVLTGGVEAINFHEFAAGARFASSNLDVHSVLEVLDPSHKDVTARFFECIDGEILLKETVVPAMYTTDPFVIRQDCLCYFMSRMDNQE